MVEEMKRIIFILILITLFSSLVQADVLPAGKKYVSYCFVIENQNDYSDYVFLLYGEPLVHGELIRPNDCTSFYKMTTPRVYAIKNIDFNKEEFNIIREVRSKENSERLRIYFEENQKMLTADQKLNNYGTISEYDHLEQAKDYIKVTIKDNVLYLKKEKVTYIYEDGSSEEILYQNYFDNQPPFPEPSKSAILPWWTNTALMSSGFILVIASLITIIILAVKKFRK